MTLQHRRCAMISGTDKDVGPQRHNRRHTLVELLGPLDFGREVAIFAGGVGVLKVDEEKVVLVPVLLQYFHLLVQGRGIADDVHPDQPCQALVHRIDGDRGGAKSINLLEGWQLWLGSEAPEGSAICFLFAS